jgi:hypothetical protein
MPKSLFCNSFEVGHNREAFCLIFKFQGPDGNVVETAYVAVSPSGAKTLSEQFIAEMNEYQRRYGNVEAWKTAGNSNPTSQGENAEKYRV